MKKPVHSVIILLLALQLMGVKCAYATNYYVNPSSITSIADGTITNPWKTINQVNDTTLSFAPGDTIFFKRGETYFGRLNIKGSGTSDNPIVYMAYGNGGMPEFTDSTSVVIMLKNVQYIQIDGFKIIDKTMDTSNHAITAKIAYGIILENSPNCTVRNCDISLVGIGIAPRFGSDNTTISNNYIHNLRIVVNTIGGIDDFGATGIVIGSSDNKVMHNKVKDCWANSYDFGYDGGVVELFGQQMNNNKIMYNTAIDCNGFLELGSKTNGHADNNILAYNKIINCGTLGIFHNDSIMFIATNNTQLLNNVIIDTKKQFAPARELLWFGDFSKPDSVIMRNNIFWNTSGINFIRNNADTTRIIHTNNVYLLRGGTLGFAVKNSEYLTKAERIFTDTASINPNDWNLYLPTGSPAINIGANVGFINDFVGNKIVGAPDAGILEKQLPLNLLATIDAIKCYGDSAAVTIVSTDGIIPYNGTGTFKVAVGKYNYTVTDSIGTSNSIEVNITQPAKLNLQYSYTTIVNISDTTQLINTASGGVPPYLYQLNTGGFQASGIFNGVTAGLYKMNVQDKNGCLSSSDINIRVSPNTPLIGGKLLLTVFPNPSNSFFTVNSIQYQGQPVFLKLRIFNTTGNLVYTLQGLSNVPYSFGSNFPSGTYTLVAEFLGNSQTVQLIKF